jgi:hypothetical protein
LGDALAVDGEGVAGVDDEVAEGALRGRFDYRGRRIRRRLCRRGRRS